jgi:predicted small integral membrane protein
MAWDWVPAVSAATSTTIVVGMTLWATSRPGREGREHAETVARQTAEHAEKMAADVRQHKRLESAYIELLQVIERAGNWAGLVCPVMDTNPPRPLPDLPSIDEQVRVRALVTAYGSVKVQELFDEYIGYINEMNVAQQIVAFAKSESDGRTQLEQREKIDRELRPAERQMRDELGEMIAMELRGAG